MTEKKKDKEKKKWSSLEAKPPLNAVYLSFLKTEMETTVENARVSYCFRETTEGNETFRRTFRKQRLSDSNGVDKEKESEGN